MLASNSGEQPKKEKQNKIKETTSPPVISGFQENALSTRQPFILYSVRGKDH